MLKTILRWIMLVLFTFALLGVLFTGPFFILLVRMAIHPLIKPVGSAFCISLISTWVFYMLERKLAPSTIDTPNWRHNSLAKKLFPNADPVELGLRARQIRIGMIVISVLSLAYAFLTEALQPLPSTNNSSTNMPSPAASLQ